MLTPSAAEQNHIGEKGLLEISNPTCWGSGLCPAIPQHQQRCHPTSKIWFRPLTTLQKDSGPCSCLSHLSGLTGICSCMPLFLYWGLQTGHLALSLTSTGKSDVIPPSALPAEFQLTQPKMQSAFAALAHCWLQGNLLPT